jgi:hypothetical protein
MLGNEMVAGRFAKDQIFNGIVQFIAIDMMHNFSFAEWAANGFFHLKAMLNHVSSLRRLGMIWRIYVPISVAYKAAAAPFGIASASFRGVVTGLGTEDEFCTRYSRIGFFTGFTHTEYWHG